MAIVTLNGVMYSLIETAKENKMSPYDYLVWVIKQTPGLDLRKKLRLIHWLNLQLQNNNGRSIRSFIILSIGPVSILIIELEKVLHALLLFLNIVELQHLGRVYSIVFLKYGDFWKYANINCPFRKRSRTVQL